MLPSQRESSCASGSRDQHAKDAPEPAGAVGHPIESDRLGYCRSDLLDAGRSYGTLYRTCGKHSAQRNVEVRIDPGAIHVDDFDRDQSCV